MASQSNEKSARIQPTIIIPASKKIVAFLLAGCDHLVYVRCITVNFIATKTCRFDFVADTNYAIQHTELISGPDMFFFAEKAYYIGDESPIFS